MSGALPVSVDPVRLADQDAQLRGTLPIARMKRLVSMCVSDAGEAQLELHFRRETESGLRRITGRIEAVVRIRCERCMEPFALPLTAEVDLLLAPPGSGELAGESDVLEAAGPISLSEMVENELILAMPMVPMHPADQCPSALAAGKTGKEDASTETHQDNPFGVLAALREKDADKQNS
jgi:uncharacterized protein